MLFDKSIDEYRPIYFHFLDGLLNTTSGGNFIDVLLTINNILGLEIDLFNFVKLDLYLSNAYINIYSNNLFEYKVKRFFNYNDQEITQRLLTQKLLTQKLGTPVAGTGSGLGTPVAGTGSGLGTPVAGTSLEQSEPLFFEHLREEYFKFTIIPTFFNKHQTTTIIFVDKKTKKMYLYILNTGLDIEENGPKEIINGQKLDQLCKGICICENLDNDDELLKGWHILYNFFYISYFYNYIESHSYSEEKNYRKYKFNSEFKNKLLYFDYILNEKFSSIKIFNNTSREKDLTINELIQIIDSGKLLNQKIFLYFKENYYSFVSKFIDINNKVAIGKIIDISNFNYTSIEKLDKKFSENFLKKIILYNQNDNLYIHAQESASCSWNSIYFSMLFFSIFGGYDSYIELINLIP
jgi:hypothetical protein